MKYVAVILSMLLSGMAVAEETEKPVEEVVVRGYHFDIEELRGKLMMGLSGAYLIHEYDKTKDEWVFVRASTDKKED